MNPSWHLSADSLIADTSLSLDWFQHPARNLPAADFDHWIFKFQTIYFGRPWSWTLVEWTPFRRTSVSDENHKNRLIWCWVSAPSRIHWLSSPMLKHVVRICELSLHSLLLSLHSLSLSLHSLLLSDWQKRAALGFSWVGNVFGPKSIGKSMASRV